MEILTIRKIQVVGTSLCVVIPKNILRALKMERGDNLIFRVFDNDTIVMRKITNEEFKLLKPDVIL